MSTSGGTLPVAVITTGSGTPGDRVLAGLAGMHAGSVQAGGNPDLSPVLATIVLAQLDALMQRLNAEGI